MLVTKQVLYRRKLVYQVLRIKRILTTNKPKYLPQTTINMGSIIDALISSDYSTEYIKVQNMLKDVRDIAKKLSWYSLGVPLRLQDEWLLFERYLKRYIEG